MIIRNKRIEIIEREGKTKFRRKSKAKNMKGWINGFISSYSKKGNTELEFIFREVLNAYNHFHPEKKTQTEVKSWKGKSSIEIIKEIDKLIIIKYQKPDKESEPKEVRTEITKEELETLIDSIKYYKDEIKTSNLAMTFSSKLNLGHRNWKEFFSDRYWHNRLTLMLNALDSLGFVKYKGGITKLLDRTISIQEVL